MTVNIDLSITEEKEHYGCGFRGVIKNDVSVCDKIFDTTEEARDCAYGHLGLTLGVYRCNYPDCNFVAMDFEDKNGKISGGVSAVKKHHQEMHAKKFWSIGKTNEHGQRYVGNFWCLWCQKCHQLIDGRIVSFKRQIAMHQFCCLPVAYSVIGNKRTKLGMHNRGDLNPWEEDIIYRKESEKKEMNFNNVEEFPPLVAGFIPITREQYCDRIAPIVRARFIELSENEKEYEKYGIELECTECKEKYNRGNKDIIYRFNSKFIKIDNNVINPENKYDEYRNAGVFLDAFRQHLSRHRQMMCLENLETYDMLDSIEHKCNSELCVHFKNK